MAAPAVRSGTLTINTPATVVINGTYGVWVENRTQTGTVWARGDGQVATVAGDNCWSVVGRRYIPLRWLSPAPAGPNVISTDGSVSISLVASAALEYTVEAAEQVDATGVLT